MLQHVLSGGRLGAARLSGRWVIVTLILAVLVAAVSAVAELAHEPYDAASRALVVVFRYVIPLTAVGAVSLATERKRLDLSLWCLARHGMPRGQLALGVVGSSMIATVIVAITCTLCTLLLAHRGGAHLLTDVVTTLPIAALTGCAYAAWLSFGATWWRGGGGRWLALALDFLLGGGTSALAVWLPRAHVESLVQGEPVLDLPAASSSVILAGMAGVWLLAAAWRSGR